MIEYQTAIAHTPGGKKVSVRLIQKDYPIRQGKYRFVVPFLDDTGIRLLAEIIRERINRMKDVFVIVTGDRGCGKSTLILRLCLEVDKAFSVDHIAFKLEDFGRLFNENPQGDGSKGVYPQVVMDEAGHALYGMDWLTKEQKIIAKELIISRIKRQILYMAVPKRKQLNNQVRDMAFVWIHVSEPEDYYQGYAVVRLAPPKIQSEFHSEKLWTPKFAFVFPQLEGALWDEYEKRKIAFVNEVTDDIAAGRASSRTVEQRNEAIRECLRMTALAGQPVNQAELGRKLGLSRSQMSEIVHGRRDE